ncbi:MAG: 50S ribosomal protein L15 [Candidatus Cloacimonadia bacterium]
MRLNEIQPPKGMRHKKKRLGKGSGSGYGKTAGRGHKGQKSRSGGNVPVWFEGGQMPIQRRLPRKGFKNFSKKSFRIVTLNHLARLEEEEIDISLMEKYGLIASGKTHKNPVKVLANTDTKFEQKKIVKANQFSKKAKELIEKFGGKAEVV